MTVRDGRITPPPDYETSGFRLLEQHSAVTDWHDEAHLAEVHAPEVESLAREMLGADRVLVYPPIVRSPRNALKIEDYAPIQFVHSDFTDDFRPMCQEPERPYRAFIEPMLESVGLTQEDVRRASRVLMLQFWRNIGPRRPDFPLAFCDAAGVPREQLHPFLVPEYGGRRLEFETFGVRPPAEADDHHWYSFPELGID
jgi:hypothetical protein